MDGPRQTFDDMLRDFVEENTLTPTDRELLTHKGLGPAFVPHGGGIELRVEGQIQAAVSRRDRAAMAIDLPAIRTVERQAESRDRQAKAMRGLTWALVVVAVLQACVAGAGVLAAFGQVVAAIAQVIAKAVLPWW
jgi:hypothetical protein